MASKPGVLFVSRRFPPSKGGMERYAADLSAALSHEVSLRSVVWTRQNKWLSVGALPILFSQAFFKLLTDPSIKIIHSQDALTAPAAWLLGKLFGKPFVTVVHGLDVTYANPLYVHTILPFVRRARKVIANSSATAQAARERNIRNVVVITPGVAAHSPLLGAKKSLDQVGLGHLANKRIVLTVGRLVKRKGVAWFIGNVLPSLVENDPHIVYVVVGGGAGLEEVQAAIQTTGLDEHVEVLGRVDDPVKLALLGAAQVFVMPNIEVKGDMEGFGLVAHEAALAEVPLVASRLEGIADAVVDGQNGTLVTSGDASAFRQAIKKVLAQSKAERNKSGKRAREFTLRTYGWHHIAAMFKTTYETVISEGVPKRRVNLKATLAVLVLVATAVVVMAYLFTHPHVVGVLGRVSAAAVLGILLAYTVAFVGLAIVLYYSVRLYGKRVSSSETVLLNAYSSVTNFFGPGQSGSGVRAVYLKVKHGLKVRSFIFSSLIYYAVYSVLSIMMLLAGAGEWVWAIVAALAACLLSFGIMRVYQRRNRRTDGIVNPIALLGILIGTLIQLTSLAVVYYLEVTSVQHGISLAQAISYAGGANMSLFIAITPGAIGVREALLVLVRSLHHIDNNTIVAAGVIDRAAYLVYLGLLFMVIAAMHGRSRLAAFRKG